jgi:hypothetical protein
MVKVVFAVSSPDGELVVTVVTSLRGIPLALKQNYFNSNTLKIYLIFTY